MPLTEKERENIIEEETLRLETRRKLMSEAWAARRGGCGSGYGCSPRRGFRFFFFLLALGGLALFFAGCHSHSPKDRAEHVVKMIASKLDLRADQKAKLEGIKDEWLAERAKWDGTHDELAALLIAQFKADSLDEKAVNGFAEAKQAKLAESRKFAVKKLAEFHALLDAKQRAKAAELIEKFNEKCKSRCSMH